MQTLSQGRNKGSGINPATAPWCHSLPVKPFKLLQECTLPRHLKRRALMCSGMQWHAAHLCAEALTHLNAAMRDQHRTISIHTDGSRHSSRRAVKPAQAGQTGPVAAVEAGRIAVSRLAVTVQVCTCLQVLGSQTLSTLQPAGSQQKIVS
jgi:hypothetical protein